MASQTAGISFADNLGTELVDIFVGPDSKRYVVHKRPLTTQSEYFRNAFKGDFKEARENSIHFKEEDPDAVALLIEWVYKGVIPGTEIKVSPFAQPYTMQSTVNSNFPVATSINGSQYPYTPTSVMDPDSLFGNRTVYHHIGSQPQYQMFSQEELRIADYEAGRRYYDWNPATSHIQSFLGTGLSGNRQHVAPHPQPPVTAQPAPAPPVATVPASGSPSQSGITSNGNAQTVPLAPALTVSDPILTSSGASSSSSQSRGPFGNRGQASPTTSLSGFTPNSLQTRATSSSFGLAQPASSLINPMPTGGSAINSTPIQHLPNPNTSSSHTDIRTTAAQSTPYRSIFGSFNTPGSSQASATQQAGGLFAGLGISSSQSQPQQTNGLLSSSLPSNSSDWTEDVPMLAPWVSSSSLSGSSRGPPSGYIRYPESVGIPIPGIPQGDSMAARSAAQQNKQLALLHLCLLAETILWPELYNAAIDAYVRGELNLHRPIPPKHVDLIYDRTPSGSSLRAYVLESMCINRGDTLMYMELTKRYDELLEAILNKLSTWRISEEKAKRTQDDFIRSLHMRKLEKGPGKDRKDVEVAGFA